MLKEQHLKRNTKKNIMPYVKNTLIKSNIYMFIYIYTHTHFNTSKQHNKNKESTHAGFVVNNQHP